MRCIILYYVLGTILKTFRKNIGNILIYFVVLYEVIAE